MSEVHDNLIPNSTGRLGLIGWQPSPGSGNWTASKYGREYYYYYIACLNGETGEEEEWYLESLPIIVNGGRDMAFKGRINTGGQTAGTAGIEVVYYNALHEILDSKRVSQGVRDGTWKNFELAFETPITTAYIKVRCFIGPNSKTAFTGWRTLKLEYGEEPTFWNDPIDPTLYEEYLMMLQHSFLYGNVHKVYHSQILDIRGADPQSEDEKQDKHISNAQLKSLIDRLDYFETHEKIRFYKRTYLCSGASNEINLPEGEFFTVGNDSLDVYVNSMLQEEELCYTEREDGTGILFGDGDLQDGDIVTLKWFIRGEPSE